jgi:3',5'-nucleoside bisphosphate phosphatase
LEIHYPTHSRKTKKKLKALALELDLLATGGSDFHGMTRPAHGLAGRGMGFCPPCIVLDELIARLRGRHM